MKNDREEDFIMFARQALEQDLQGMDAATCNHLAQARATAMENEVNHWRIRLVPVASLAVVATAALLIFLWPVARGPDTRQLALEDIDILASDADMDVLADPDFYRWLENNNHAG